MANWIINNVGNLPFVVQLLIYFAFLGAGVFCLVKFCDILVDNASGIAKKLHISPMIIGLTIVAIGTSCPELAVSVSNSITVLANGGGNANIALGNVVGSNICNLLLVLGFSTVFTPIVVKRSVCKREFPFLLIVTGLLVFFGLMFGLTGVFDGYVILRWEAAILVVIIPIYIWFLIHNAKKHPEDAIIEEEETEEKPKKTGVLVLLAILGAIGVALGGELVTIGAQGSALSISTAANLDRDTAELVIGLTVVAVGTSLPELVTSTIAAKRGENELALGNVIGSNIFNTIFVLGIAGVICPLSAGSGIVVDMAVMMGVTVLVFVFALVKGKITRAHGFTLLGIYVIYVTYLVLRALNVIAF